MTYGEAFDFCMAGGKVRATKKRDSQVSEEWVIWFDDCINMWAWQLQSPKTPVAYGEGMPFNAFRKTELERWTFEDADPKPTFEVRAEVDDDSALCVSIFWRGGLVIGTDRDDAVQLFEALGKAIRCEACGGYLDVNGECNAGKHNEKI